MTASLHEWKVEAGSAGRLDKFLSSAPGPELSRAQVQRLIEEGQVTVDGRVVAQASLKLKAGQQVTIIIPEAKPLALEAVPMALEILYEDAELLVINKPAGLTVHPAPGETGPTLVHGLLAHCGDSLSGIGGVQRPGIVHRLDKDTSGAMLVAKTDRAHQSLSAQLKDRSLSRTYHAVVYGLPNPTSGIIEGNIGRHPKDRKRMAVLENDAGKPARTHYRVLEVFGSRALSLIECKLESGRTHQIRVHLTHIGHPLVGDPVYGRPRKLADAELQAVASSFTRQALHAVALQFIHPVTGEAMRYDAAYPQDFAEFLAKIVS